MLNYSCRESISDKMNQALMDMASRWDLVTMKRKLKLTKGGRDKDSMRKYAKEYHSIVKLMVSVHIISISHTVCEILYIINNPLAQIHVAKHARDFDSRSHLDKPQWSLYFIMRPVALFTELFIQFWKLLLQSFSKKLFWSMTNL